MAKGKPGKQKGHVSDQVLADIPRIVEMIGDGKEDHEICKELQLSRSSLEIRFKYMREKKVLALHAGDAAWRSIARLVATRKKAQEAWDFYWPNPKLANAAIGSLRLMADVDDKIVDLALKLGVLPMVELPEDTDPYSDQDLTTKTDEQVLNGYNSRLNSLN
ncbi:MAG: hypothetical protein E6R04_10700 [Spirochaetes bacterium]|nr:MAG: hypothetical protein E6R04_10700 [Spirochaetota bacterium]